MKHMTVDEVSIKDLFAQRKAFFSIPAFQRPYAWTIEQCAELWDDLYWFAFPDGRPENFDPNVEEYFLGSIVTHHDDRIGQDEVIDGQQRIITLSLLLRALYCELRDKDTGKDVGMCLWAFDEERKLDYSTIRIASKVSLDKDRDCLEQILRSGDTNKKDKDNYSCNYRFFQRQIFSLNERAPSMILKFAARIIDNTFVVRLCADTQTNALKLFMTINNRGLSLTPADIFKADLYEHHLACGGEEGAILFLKRWDKMTERCETVFKGLAYSRFVQQASELPFFFLLNRNRNFILDMSKVIGILHNNNGQLLKDPKTLKDIEAFLEFALSLKANNTTLIYTDEILRKAYILFRINTTVIWTMLFEFFFANRNTSTNRVDNDQLNLFLERLIAYIVGSAVVTFSYNITAPNHAIFWRKILVLGDKPDDDHKFPETIIRENLNTPDKLKGHMYQKVLLNWWTFRNSEQPYASASVSLQREHIMPTSWARNNFLNNPNCVELLGNIAYLEKTINDRAKNFEFRNKRYIYRGAHLPNTDATYEPANKKSPLKPTFNVELLHLAEEKEDFTEADIIRRNQEMTEAVIALLRKHDLLL